MTQQLSIMTVVAALALQSVVFEKTIGALVLRVLRNADERLSVSLLLPGGTTYQPLPIGVESVSDVRAWGADKLIVVGSRDYLSVLSIVSATDGSVVDNVFTNPLFAVAENNQRIAFDLSRSRVHSQSAVISLYDVGKSPSENRMPGQNANGIAVYPAFNRLNQSFEIEPQGEPKHVLKSPLVWATNEILTFCDFVDGQLVMVVVEATNVGQPLVRTAPIDISGLVNAPGTSGPTASFMRLFVVLEIEPIDVHQGYAKLRLKLRPGSWLLQSEIEVEF